jgi:hypothetical protein
MNTLLPYTVTAQITHLAEELSAWKELRLAINRRTSNPWIDSSSRAIETR